MEEIGTRVIEEEEEEEEGGVEGALLGTSTEEGVLLLSMREEVEVGVVAEVGVTEEDEEEEEEEVELTGVESVVPLGGDGVMRSTCSGMCNEVFSPSVSVFCFFITTTLSFAHSSFVCSPPFLLVCHIPSFFCSPPSPSFPAAAAAPPAFPAEVGRNEVVGLVVFFFGMVVRGC